MNLGTEILDILRAALNEDTVWEDETSQNVLLDPTKRIRAEIYAREPGVFSGEAIISGLDRILGNPISFDLKKKQGDQIEKDEVILSLTGEIGACLGVERTLLNFLAITCGTATLTRKFVDAVKPFPTKILATRKTIPGLRAIQLNAVVAGGGQIHRRNLSDGVLIKDNHLHTTSIQETIERAKMKVSPLHRVEIEVENLEQLGEALLAKPDVVMLDNFELPELQNALALTKGKCEVEVSGGMTLEKVRAIAELGVDYISVGRLTHSAPAFDLSLEIVG